jgi:hypothetical protein
MHCDWPLGRYYQPAHLCSVHPVPRNSRLTAPATHFLYTYFSRICRTVSSSLSAGLTASQGMRRDACSTPKTQAAQRIAATYTEQGRCGWCVGADCPSSPSRDDETCRCSIIRQLRPIRSCNSTALPCLLPQHYLRCHIRIPNRAVACRQPHLQHEPHATTSSWSRLMHTAYALLPLQPLHPMQRVASSAQVLTMHQP